MKKTLSIFIVILALTAGIFIIGKNVVSNKGKISLKNPESRPELARILKEKPAGAPPQDEITKPRTESVKTVSYDNSTEKIAKKIAQEIIRKNPEGPSLLEGRRIIDALDPDKLIDGILKEEFSTFDYTEFKPETDLTKLKIIPLADKEAVELYLKNFQKALRVDAALIPLNPANFSAQKFQKISQELEKLTARLYGLPVPKDLAGLHAEEIALLSAQKNIFGALADIQSDPLKTLFAVNALGPVNQELAELKKKYLDFISKNNLNI